MSDVLRHLFDGDDLVAAPAVCEEAATKGVVEAVNFNSPGQVVIAGAADAVGHAVELASARGARRAIVLPVSVPSHSSLMQEAGESLAESLAAANFRSPEITVIGAANAEPYTDADDIRQRLSVQVYSPVQWVATIHAMTSGGATRIVECGPGKVLAGLIRRIDRSIDTGFIHDHASLEKSLGA